VTQLSFSQAGAELARRDPIVAGLIERHGPVRLHRPPRAEERFATLAESIAYQQLNGRAAATIHARLVAALHGEVTPAGVLALSVEELRACGLSRAKAASMRDLAAMVTSGELALERIGRMSDEDVVDHLIQVRGIGRWTAEMFLLFSLRRLDVWPVGDYGVRAGYAAAWSLAEAPSPKQLDALGDRFRPYRSVVAWYCWRALDQRSVVTT
jgi:3-methyladenine DNA glycosylase/8-oxoguanine DNA glycosylase